MERSIRSRLATLVWLGALAHVLLGASHARATEGASVVANGSFSAGLERWTLGASAKPAGRVVSSGCLDDHCLELSVPLGGHAQIGQPLPSLAPGARHRIRARVHASKRHRVRVSVSDTSWKGPYCVRKPLDFFVEANGVDDWQSFDVGFTVPERDECGPTDEHRWQVEIAFESLRGARPAVLIDEISVAQVEDESPRDDEAGLLCTYFRDYHNLDPCPGQDDRGAMLATASQWVFDEGEGRLLHDAFEGRNGVALGEQIRWHKGALHFSGASSESQVRVDAGQAIDGETFEIALEVMPAKDWKAGCLIASQPQAGVLGGFRLCYSRETQVLGFELSNGSAHREYAAVLSRPMEPGMWTQVRVRGHAGALEFLVDGRSVKRFAVPGLRLYKGPYPLVIGAGVEKSEAGFRGAMRNVTLRGEVGRRSKTREAPPGFTARGYWRIDEGEGIVVRDSASDHHGVLELPPERVSPTWRGENLRFGGTKEAGGVMIRNAGPFYGDNFSIEFDAMFDDPANDWGSLLVSKTGSAVGGGFIVDFTGRSRTLTIKLADGKRNIELKPKLPFTLVPNVWTPIRIRFAHEELRVTVAGVEVSRFDLPGFVLARAQTPLLVGAYYYPPSKGLKGSIRDVALYMRDDSIAENEVEFLRTGVATVTPAETPCRAKPLHATMVVGSNVLVPNWFGSTCNRKLEGDGRFVYEIDLPKGFELLASGSNNVAKGKITENEVERISKLERDGRAYRRYRVELSYRSTAGGESGFGPLFIRGNLDESGPPPRMYFRESGAEPSTDLGSVALVVREFPALQRAEKLHLSLAWMALHNAMEWPKFFRNYRALGFNAVPTLSSYDVALKERTRKKFLDRARDKGFDLLVVDSPYHRMIFNREARIESEDGRAEPFVDPSYRGVHYDAELARITQDHETFAPDWYMMDIECFTNGAYACLIGTSPRCSERLAEIAGTETLDPSGALLDLGTELISNIRTAIDAVDAKHPPPHMGLYSTEPGSIDQHLFDFRKLYDEPLDYAQPTLYRETPDRMGKRMREIRAAMPRGDIIPWIDPGTIKEFPSIWIYDRVMEVFGSGGRGLAWFAFTNFEGSDFHALARALDAVIPVEDVIVGSEPMAEIEVVAGDVAATGISNGDHHLLLLSDYRAPQRQRAVRLELPNGVEGSIWDLARKRKIGDVVDGVARLDWRLAVPGARTALYYVGPSTFEEGRVTIPEPGGS